MGSETRSCMYLSLFALYMGRFQPTKPVKPAHFKPLLHTLYGFDLVWVLPHNPVTDNVVFNLYPCRAHDVLVCVMVSIRALRKTSNSRRFSSTLGAAPRDGRGGPAHPSHHRVHLAGDDGSMLLTQCADRSCTLAIAQATEDTTTASHSTTMAAPGGVPVSSSWTMPMASPIGGGRKQLGKVECACGRGRKVGDAY